MITTLKDKRQLTLATWTETEPADKRGKPFVIPFYFVHPEYGLTDLKEYPLPIIGDPDLAKVLQVSRQVIWRWKTKNIIPFRRGPGKRPTYAYNVKSVVEALEKHGYFRDNE